MFVLGVLGTLGLCILLFFFFYIKMFLALAGCMQPVFVTDLLLQCTVPWVLNETIKVLIPFSFKSQELKESVQSGLRHQVTLLIRPMQQVNTSFHFSI